MAWVTVWMEGTACTAYASCVESGWLVVSFVVGQGSMLGRGCAIVYYKCAMFFFHFYLSLWYSSFDYCSCVSAVVCVFFMILVRRMKTTLAHSVGVSVVSIPG